MARRKEKSYDHLLLLLRQAGTDDTDRPWTDYPCLEWDWSICGGRSGGYGNMKYPDGRNDKTHRAAWKLTRGEILFGLFVCHRCDNRRCIRPIHLFLGTNDENIADMRAKGRQRYVGHDGLSQSKVTNEQISQIRSLWANGNLRQKEIAILFGVNQQRISAIVNAKIRTNRLSGDNVPLPGKPGPRKSQIL